MNDSTNNQPSPPTRRVRSDDGFDVEFERNGRTLKGDVKATTHGWSTGCEPVLKYCEDKFEENKDELDFIFFVEIIDESTVRIIGYIEPGYVEEVAERVPKGETFCPGEPRYSCPSLYADNLMCKNDYLRYIIPRREE